MITLKQFIYPVNNWICINGKFLEHIKGTVLEQDAWWCVNTNKQTILTNVYWFHNLLKVVYKTRLERNAWCCVGGTGRRPLVSCNWSKPSSLMSHIVSDTPRMCMHTLTLLLHHLHLWVYSWYKVDKLYAIHTVHKPTIYTKKYYSKSFYM